jgi:hypothetical protein
VISVSLVVLAIAAAVSAVGVAAGVGNNHHSQGVPGREIDQAAESRAQPSCAHRIGQAPINRNRRSSHILVPVAPSHLLLCRYYGSFAGASPSPREGELIVERFIGRGGVVRSLGRAFDRLSPLPPGEYTCPADNGAALYALFIYESEADVPVMVSLSGCRAASNGRTPHAFSVSVDLLRRLKRLTRARENGSGQ